jgi:2-C-methyl-D-erythritol 4-phosphate cytidylyltransferase/2-C-methyl-D-erythritol 2,4-cyclodiphosphate synthase
MYKECVVSVIIAAAGSGSRMDKNKINKQYRSLGHMPILARTIEQFEKNPYIDEIIITVREEDMEYCQREIVQYYQYDKVAKLVKGGRERQDSVYNGLMAIREDADLILIHDGARPFVHETTINHVIMKTHEEGAATVGVALKDTVKWICKGKIEKHINRESVMAMQTPQGFRRNIIMHAYDLARSDNYQGTDDNALVERIGIKPIVVAGDYKNIKITTEEDMMIAEAFLREEPSMKIGIGYDVHRLVEGKKLILGGIEVHHEKGLLGYSDADVLVHAIMDSMLGACALGDIGKHFPDNKGEYKDISSIILLKRVVELIRNEGYNINNVDTVIIAQRPKIAPYIEDMRENLSQAMGIDKDRISIKATTTEGLGFEGREEGISAKSITLLVK